ncbi:hypothetical protein FSS13T_26410 [Flavobacterium saliperosum S13]|uniref:Uncharacterized protein n=2 Tax=Flavobacterium saliperosum TaxID=329186 RepID=A0A1G4W4K9_9FLAO|nr:hypothetical protein [Flavobacterium saliperosum]ESU21485.1 hypothetical protein FSS13T_26410 [Flavobacterium saliperosum S13]SCX16671.1 hypothetical protein SAMN02927925_02400 [Flavobacterium saliperosum]
MKKLLITIFSALLFVSCKTVLLKVKGVKDPKIENYSSAKKYLHKNDMDTTRVVYFKDFYSLAQASKKKYLQIPDTYFFDRNGNFVDYRKSATDCNAKVDGFIQDLNAFSEAKKDSTKNLTELKSFLVGSDKKLLSEKPGEITVFITWARYAGALNKEKAFDWVKLLEQAKQKGISVNYYLLNCDFQESWNLTKEQKEALGVN